MRVTVLVLVLIAAAGVVGFFVARSTGPGARERVPDRLDRGADENRNPPPPDPGPANSRDDAARPEAVPDWFGSRSGAQIKEFLGAWRNATPARREELLEHWRRTGAKEPSVAPALLGLLRVADDAEEQILIGDLAAECDSFALSADEVDEVLGLLRDSEASGMRYAAARFSRSVWELKEGKDRRIRLWIPIARERIENDENIGVVIGLADLVGDHYGATDDVVAALRARADRMPAGADHRALRLALAKDDVRMRYELVDGEMVPLPTPRWEHFYSLWERAPNDELREDHAQVIAEFLQTFSVRADVDDEHASTILEQCATMYGRTARKETRIALLVALWNEHGGRFRGSALDALIAIEPDKGLRARMETLRKKLGWGQIADAEDVLVILRGA